MAVLSAIYATTGGWDRFYWETGYRLERVYPYRAATMTSSAPYFLTPEDKQLLRKKESSDESWKSGEKRGNVNRERHEGCEPL